MTLLHDGLIYFHSTYKIVFIIHIKYSSFGPSAVIEHLLNYIVHAML